MSARKTIRVTAKLCRDCQACVLGCSLFHEKICNVDLACLTVKKDMARFEFHINLCRHCKNPKCMSDCPSDAMYVDDRGVVIIVDEKCTRCGNCQSNCPFDSIFYEKITKKYLKCDLCAGREAGPVCIELCPVCVFTLEEQGTKKGLTI